MVYNHFIPFSRGCGVFGGDRPSSLWAKAGYTLDKTPAHCSMEAENSHGFFFFYMHCYLVITTYYLVILI